MNRHNNNDKPDNLLLEVEECFKLGFEGTGWDGSDASFEALPLKLPFTGKRETSREWDREASNLQPEQRKTYMQRAYQKTLPKKPSIKAPPQQLTKHQKNMYTPRSRKRVYGPHSNRGRSHSASRSKERPPTEAEKPANSWTERGWTSKGKKNLSLGERKKWVASLFRHLLTHKYQLKPHLHRIYHDQRAIFHWTSPCSWASLINQFLRVFLNSFYFFSYLLKYLYHFFSSTK